MSSTENRIKKLEKQTDQEADGRETLIIYPSGKLRHCCGDGPVKHTDTIKVVSKRAAELTLEILNGKGTEHWGGAS